MATVTATAISNGFPGQKTLIRKYELDYNKFINFCPLQKNYSPKLPRHPIEPSRLSVKMRGVYPVQATVAKVIKTPTDLTQEDGKAERSILVIDNYDSFTYNLCQYLGDLGVMFDVYRNDDLTLEEVKEKNPRGILISPGPGTPRDSGISLQTVVQLGPTVPLFGVCMGLQCMGEAFGGKIVRSPYGVMHGKKSLIYYDEKGEDGILAGLPNPFIAGRYHSLVVDEKSFPHNELEITAWTEDGLVMAARHKKHRHIQGVQFHPESIITPEGNQIVQNFISIIERLEQKSSL
uniref:anthranilate synthase n=1 Tax=Wollemia nobilis TaxID=56998 RepID=A0A0C9S857_9CONI